MKKIKIFSVILFLVSTTIFAGCGIYDKFMTDHTPPVISGEGVLQVSVGDPEELLLEGMKAEDERDGDVTDSLVVQKISEFNDENQRMVTYAAVDTSGNVGYFSRPLEYTDYQEPQFKLSEPLRFPTGTDINICRGISAESTLDGNLTTQIKYTLDKAISTTVTGTYTIEFRVTDSAGKTSYLKTELEVYDSTKEIIDVELSSYLVYIKKGSSFDAADYYVGADVDEKPDIHSNVDSSTSGVYYADYTVSRGTISGKSRLIVVVK